MATSYIQPEREKTFRVAISALKTNPAYLTVFCLGLMGGPVVGAALLNPDKNVAIVATVAWTLFLLVSILVVAFVETRRNQLPDSSFEPPDEMARTTFLESREASMLSGRWHVHWFSGTGNDRKPYDLDPNETAIISTSGPSLFIHSYDASTSSEYWLFGRISEKSDVSLIYWSKRETNMLSGVVFLAVDESFESKGNKMSGWWHGRTRDGNVTFGDVEFIRYGHNE